MAAEILLVEDNEDILQINKETLRSEGYAVHGATTLAQAEKILQEEPVSLIVLDVMLPDGSGVDFCQKIRGTVKAPVLFLTCMDEHSQVVDGLRAGGDDYMTKPYDLDELLARVDALLRRYRQEDEPAKDLKYGPLRIDYVSRRAFLQDRDLLLTPREFALLSVLLQWRGQICPKEALYKEAWGQEAGTDFRTLRVHVSTLRKKLNPDFGIEYVSAKGYHIVRDANEEKGN